MTPDRLSQDPRDNKNIALGEVQLQWELNLSIILYMLDV